jgi:hypothetical protein
VVVDYVASWPQIFRRAQGAQGRGARGARGRKGAQGTDGGRKGRKGQTGGSPSQETHGTGNCKGYALSVPGFSRQAAPTRIAFHSNPAAPCKGEVLDAGKPPLACKKFLDENEKAAAESELERRFREFEAKFWGLRFKCETTSWVRNPPAACKSSQFSPPGCRPPRL